MFNLNTTPKIEEALNLTLGCNRSIRNKALAISQHRLDNKKSIVWYDESALWLKLWKQSDEYTFLEEAPSQTMQQALMDLAKA